ncbi:MAG: 4Fe-4S binding protein [Coriobacteriales bacterium]
MKSKLKMGTVRGIVAFVLVVGMSAVALAFGTGTGTLSAFGVGQLAALCPVGALESWLGAKSIGVHGVICLGITVLIVLLVGKAFCAWACPTPWLQRFFHPKKKEALKADDSDENTPFSEEQLAALDASIAENLGSQGACSAEDCEGSGCRTCLAAVGGKRDGLQLDSRHVVLGGALLSSLVAGFPVFCLVCPVGLSFATLYGLWHLLQFNETTWGLLIFPALLVLELVVLRKWCHKICPLGALLSLVSNLNFSFKPKVDGSACLRNQGIDCHACVDACPEQVDPHSKRIPECSKCGACVEACPAHAIAIKPL